MSSLQSILTPISSQSNDLIEYSSGSIPVPSKELNLRRTVLGGQSFRWFEESENEFIGIVQHFLIRLKHNNDDLQYVFYTNETFSKINEEKVDCSKFLENYFQFSIRISDLIEKWSKVDQRFQNEQIPSGIRLLAQEPLENLISFICSSNNNVQRITKMIQLLCQQYGTLIGTLNNIDYYQFPTIEQLDRNDLEDNLRKLQFGYRARYIQHAVRYLKNETNDSNYFDRLKNLSVKDARVELRKILGIGRKVADCILLMSLGKQNVVPVDTHIHSIAVTHYGHEKKRQLTAGNYDDISTFFEQLWQPLAGWAQAAAFSNELRDEKTSRTKLNKKRRSEEKIDRCLSVQCKKRQRSSK